MKQVILLHNPGAGDEDHLKADLIRAIEAEGYGCVYFSIKKEESWKTQIDQADLAVIAGGDGTVRNVLKELLQRTVLDKKIPLAILPMGTANNLSKTLGIDNLLPHEQHIAHWKDSRLQPFDVGVLQSADSQDFFLESAGYGLFPQLIQHMDNKDTSHLENAKDELKLALEVLYQLVQSAQAEQYRINADGEIFEGRCILLEIMNIQSIGPNLILSPFAKTDDGVFDLVLVEEDQRDALADYIQQLIDEKEAAFDWKTIQAKKITVDCTSQYMHIDDELIVPFKNPILADVREKVVEFLI